MGFWKNKMSKWRKQLKFSVINPDNFDELWGFNSSRIQLTSFLVLLSVIVGVIFTLLVFFTPLSTLFVEDTKMAKSEMVAYKLKIDSLEHKINAQKEFYTNLETILNGGIPLDSLAEPKVLPNIDPNDIDYSMSDEELMNESKVKEDIRTPSESKQTVTAHFIAPIKGIISQSFNVKDHKAIDVVAKQNEKVLSCFDGTVIYSGYSIKDGNILIIEHPNAFISIYKHNSYLFKKTGDKVRLGDPIAIVGNSGELSNGPHLHFELWYDQRPVNPEEYILFQKN